VLAGVTYCPDEAGDFWLVKTDCDGITEWSRTFGRVGREDVCYDMHQTVDGGYVLAGRTDYFGTGNKDFWLVKTNANGDSLWSRTFGDDYWDQCNAVRQTTDGGYVLAGNGYVPSPPFGNGSDFRLVKTDANGYFPWTRTYGGNDDEYCNDVDEMADGGYLVAGSTLSFGAFGSYDFWLVRTNAAGDSLWSRTFGGNGDESCNDFVPTQDGGFLLGGYTTSFGAGSADFWLVRTDANGDSLWSRTFGGSGADYCNAICRTADGGYVLAGSTTSFGPVGYDFWLVKVDANGDSLWSRTFGGHRSDDCYAVEQTTDGGYALAGSAVICDEGCWWDFSLVKTSRDPQFPLSVLVPNGGEQWRIFQNDTVRWESHGLTTNIRVELNRNYPSGAWEVLADSTANDGEEPFFISDPLSSHCRVRVSAIDDTLSDVSDGDFSIVSSQGYLALVRPAEPGTPVISWNAGTLECPQAASETFRLKNFGSEAIVVFQPLEPPSAEFSRTTSCGSFFALAPGQMSACSLRLSFTPQSDGPHRDTLFVQTDAINGIGGYVRIPLSGTQISTPAAPQVVIQTQGIDARLFWPPISQSVGGCPVTITAYLVFYAEDLGGPYLFHGYTTDTSYVHLGVVRFASGMFYHVIATTQPLSVLRSLPKDGVLTEAEVRRELAVRGGKRPPFCPPASGGKEDGRSMLRPYPEPVPAG
jgi:hypothetical protein